MILRIIDQTEQRVLAKEKVPAKVGGVYIYTLTSSIPFLVTLSLHKTWVYAASASMLALSGWMRYRPGRAGPVDPELDALCNRAWLWNRRVYWTSIILWIVGFFAAFIALPLRIWLDF